MSRNDISPDLASLGFLADDATGEYGLTLRDAGQTDNECGMQVLYSATTDEVWLETYDIDGETLALVRLFGGATMAKIVRLIQGLRGGE